MTKRLLVCWALLVVTSAVAFPALAGQPEVLEAVDAAYRSAHEASAPIRSLQQAYLRLAGIVWIGVEWIAAFVLWRVYILLNRKLGERGGQRGA
jgi:hypothetical protein